MFEIWFEFLHFVNSSLLTLLAFLSGVPSKRKSLGDSLGREYDVSVLGTTCIYLDLFLSSDLITSSTLRAVLL